MFSQTITPPATYSEWVSVLDKLKDRIDDEEVLGAMLKGKIEWQAGVAERFSKKLVDTINSRMNSASDKFQRELSRSFGQERVIIQAILSLRKELNFLSKAVNLPAIPEDIRKKYCQLVKEQADNIQKSLEDSAKRDRTGKLASIIRSNRVNAF